MSRLALGALAGALGGGLLVWAYLTYLHPPGAGSPCASYCGQGTICVRKKCVAEADLAKKNKRQKKRRLTRRKKRRIRRSRQKRPAGQASAKAQPRKIPWVNDRHIPRFDADAPRHIDADDGSGRLDEFEIDQSLAALDEDFGRCIERADQRAGGRLQNGRVDFAFGVNGQGKVIGVNAKAPAHLRRYGIVPCVREAIYKQRFRAFQGPDARVSSSFEVLFD